MTKEDIQFESQRLKSVIEVDSEVSSRLKNLIAATSSLSADKYMEDVEKCIELATGDSTVKRSQLNPAAPAYNDIIDTIVVEAMTNAAELADVEQEGKFFTKQLEAQIETLSSKLEKNKIALKDLGKPLSPAEPNSQSTTTNSALPKTLKEIKLKDYETAHQVLRSNTDILTEQESNNLFMDAFGSVLAGQTEQGRALCQNALLLKNCEQVGTTVDKVDYFFQEMSDPANPKWGDFEKEVELVFKHIQERCKVLNQAQS